MEASHWQQVVPMGLCLMVGQAPVSAATSKQGTEQILMYG